MSQKYSFFTNSLIKMVHNQNLLAENECIMDNNDNIYIYKTFTWDKLFEEEPIHGLSLMLIENKKVTYNKVTNDSECCYCGNLDDIYTICNLTLCKLCIDDGFAKDGDILNNGSTKILKRNNNKIIEISNIWGKNIYYINNNTISWYHRRRYLSLCCECGHELSREQLFIIRYGTEISFNCNKCVNIQHIGYPHVKCKTLTVSSFNDRVVAHYQFFLIKHLLDLTTDTKFYLSTIYAKLF